MWREPVAADLRPHVEGSFGAAAHRCGRSGASPKKEIKDESRVGGEDHDGRIHAEGRAGRMARQHDAQRLAGDDEG